MAYSSDKQRGFIPPQNTDEKLLQRRVGDMVKAVGASGRARFSPFLNDREIELATAQLSRSGWQAYRLEGGHEGAERRMLCVFDEPEEGIEFPFTALTIQARDGGHLTHRDFLGSLLGLGITRECVGDILVAGGTATVFVTDAVAPLVQEELRSVGRCDAQVVQEEPQALPPQGEKTTGRRSVPSLRLDAVLSAMLNMSRGAAAELVETGRVQVNHIEMTTTHSRVCEGDVFSIRGIGKYRLEAVGGTTRKNRTTIEYVKY